MYPKKVRVLLYDARHGQCDNGEVSMASLVSPNNVRARWTYSELLSLSHGDRYEGPGIPELKEKARKGVPFDDLMPFERKLLVEQLALVRTDHLLQALEGINWFQLETWTKQQLAEVYVAPYFVCDICTTFSWVTFKRWIEADPIKPLHQWHARFATYAVAPSEQGEPLTVGRYPDHPQFILLDGYHRAVRFWSMNEPTAKLAVYVPV